jgi:hypothetical protein
MFFCALQGLYDPDLKIFCSSATFIIFYCALNSPILAYVQPLVFYLLLMTTAALHLSVSQVLSTCMY